MANDLYKQLSQPGAARAFIETARAMTVARAPRRPFSDYPPNLPGCYCGDHGWGYGNSAGPESGGYDTWENAAVACHQHAEIVNPEGDWIWEIDSCHYFGSGDLCWADSCHQHQSTPNGHAG